MEMLHVPAYIKSLLLRQKEPHHQVWIYFCFRECDVNKKTGQINLPVFGGECEIRTHGALPHH